MKSINEYINEEKKTTGAGCVEMVKTILDQLTKEHSDCQYDKDKQTWTGKDADLWKGAGQFLFDYLQELDQNDLKKIVDNFGWKEYIPDVNDIHPQDVSVCVSLFLYNSKNNSN
jgi:hypothetical protein